MPILLITWLCTNNITLNAILRLQTFWHYPIVELNAWLYVFIVYFICNHDPTSAGATVNCIWFKDINNDAICYLLIIPVYAISWREVGVAAWTNNHTLCQNKHLTKIQVLSHQKKMVLFKPIVKTNCKTADCSLVLLNLNHTHLICSQDKLKNLGIKLLAIIVRQNRQ